MGKWIDDFKEIELFKDVENEEKLIKDYEELDKVFTSNMAKSKDDAKRQYLTYNHQAILGKGNDEALITAIMDNKVKIYKHRIEQHRNPSDQELQELKSDYNFRKERTGMLYWWLNCYAESKSIKIAQYYNSYLLIDGTIPVRCGELTGDMIYTLMLNNVHQNKALIVPFADLYGENKYNEVKYINFYIIEFTEEYLKELEDIRLKNNDKSMARISYRHR